MADNIKIRDADGGNPRVATDEVTPGVHVQRVKPTFGADGGAIDVSTASPLPTADTTTKTAVDAVTTAVNALRTQVSTPLTNTELRATAVPVDTELPAATALDDAGPAATLVPAVGSRSLMWNSTAWERERSPYQEIVLAQAERTTSTLSGTLRSYNFVGAIFRLNVTAVPGTPTTGLTLAIRGAGSLTTFEASASISNAIKTAAAFYFVVYPGVVAAGVGDATYARPALPTRTWAHSMPLPDQFTVAVLHGTSGEPYTYSVVASYLT